MANKKIYICDRCKSYALEEEMFTIGIGNIVQIGSGNYYKEKDPLLGTIIFSGSGTALREICKTCLEFAIDQFNLRTDAKDITDQAFAAFELPKRQ